MKLKIKEFRKALGLTQSQLAEKVGVSVSYLSEIETGKKTANTRRMTQLASALDIQPYDLLPDENLSDEIRQHLQTLSRLSRNDLEAVLRHAEVLANSR